MKANDKNNGQGKWINEKPDETIQKVLKLPKDVDACMDERKMSIEHWLPARNGSTRPNNVKFSTRVGKLVIMQQ